MPTASIFFVPVPANVSESAAPSQSIFHALAAEHALEPLQPWTLDHRLFRETTLGMQADGSGSTPSLGYLQVLTASQHGGNSYISISRPGSSQDAGTIVAVPTGSGTEEFAGMMTTRFTPLWQRRHYTQIANGQAYKIGNFTVRLGDVREARPTTGGAQPIRGTIVEITADEDLDGSAEEAIRQLWSELGVTDAKEFMQSRDTEDEFGSIRKWFEALRTRA